ncbi:reverse transcriptase domain-containing protein [Tanacetum coccineum]|uniref:Reverse transcriptase domain-containing protein n=1 Tax=Tanacetum coccineum TaxID=301880 RepID=A0ABQ5FCF7_9ASTR
MAEETLPTIPLSTPDEGPSKSDPKEPPVGANISDPAIEDHTPDRSLENTSGDPVVHNFEKINAMYSSFSTKRKEVNPTPAYNNDDHPVLELWRSDSEGSPEEAIRQAPKETTLQAKPSKKSRFTTENLNNLPKQRPVSNANFYNKPFTFTEMQKDVCNLMASPFTSRIRDYDMPDRLKVPTNLKTYDRMSDPDDHLTVFMGTMDEINNFYELRDRFRANFLQQRRFQKTQAEILGIRQRSNESLRDYLGRFGKETLHMTDRSDGMMTGAFISGLRLGRSGHLSQLAKGAKTQNSSQNPTSSSTVEKGKNQTDWKQKVVAHKAGNEVLMIGERWYSPHYQENGLRHITDISFTSDDPVPDHCRGDDPLVIKVEIGGCIIHRIYVDGVSSAEIMYEHCFLQLDNETKASLRLPTSPLVGFSGQVLWPLGVITAPFTFSDYMGKGSKAITMDFMVVRAPSPYNVILGRPGMRQLGAIASTIHSLIKFSLESSIAIIRGDVPHQSRCIQISRKRTIREVQSLNGKLAALVRFLARSAEKSLPFFKTLKGCIEKRDFWWSQEAEGAFQKLKQHLQSLSALIVPIPGETLTLYLAASHETVSSVLVAEREGIQRPIYFVSKALQGP